MITTTPVRILLFIGTAALAGSLTACDPATEKVDSPQSVSAANTTTTTAVIQTATPLTTTHTPNSASSTPSNPETSKTGTGSPSNVSPSAGLTKDQKDIANAWATYRDGIVEGDITKICSMVPPDELRQMKAKGGSCETEVGKALADEKASEFKTMMKGLTFDARKIVVKGDKAEVHLDPYPNPTTSYLYFSRVNGKWFPLNDP